MREKFSAHLVLMGTPATTIAPALSVDGLIKRYGAVTAIEDLSFSVRRGVVTGFLGPNGAGKTTTLKVIAGLARATAGHERVAGVPAGRPIADARAALLGDPQFLLLDEPLNGLDPQGIRWLRMLLRAHAAGGRTVLLSSHVLSEVAQTVDDVVVLYRGRLVRQASMEQLRQDGRGRVLVATPTRERLAAAVVRAGGRTELRDRDGLLIDGLDAKTVSGLADSEGVLLHQLATQRDSLEDLYFGMTGEETA